MYTVNLKKLKDRANYIDLIAGENLRLYRTHCKLSHRAVECETGIGYSLICKYEKEGLKNAHYYVILIGFYRDYCAWNRIGEPEGIREISSLMYETASGLQETASRLKATPSKHKAKSSKHKAKPSKHKKATASKHKAKPSKPKATASKLQESPSKAPRKKL